jgi:hypothetical protein
MDLDDLTVFEQQYALIRKNHSDSSLSGTIWNMKNLLGEIREGIVEIMPLRATEERKSVCRKLSLLLGDMAGWIDGICPTAEEPTKNQCHQLYHICWLLQYFLVEKDE